MVLNSTVASAPKRSLMKIGDSIGLTAASWSTFASLKAANSISRHMISLKDTGKNIARKSIYSARRAK